MKRMDYITLIMYLMSSLTCVVLHNLCETLGDRCQSDWFTDDTHSHHKVQQQLSPTASQPSSSTSATTAVLIRDAIRDSL